MAAFLADRRVTGVLWLLLRLWLGYAWLKAGLPKVFGDKSEAWVGDKAGAAVSGFLKGALARAEGDSPQVQAWYADFVREIALPNAKLFSYLVAYGEVLVGVALILGLVTHFAASMGIVMNLAYLFAGTISKNPQMLVAEAAIVFAGIAAGYYGIDRYLMPYLGERLGWGRDQERVGDRSRRSSTVGAA